MAEQPWPRGRRRPDRARAEERGRAYLLTQGSSELVHTLLANDLVDELRLLVYPVVLGRGKRLFDTNGHPRAFKLAKSAIASNGVVIATYERAGDISTGSFALETPTPAELERRKNLT